MDAQTALHRYHPGLATIVREPSPLSLLVVDDDPAIRTTVRAMLEYSGHTVYEAEDFCSGRLALYQRRLDGAFIDGNFPDFGTQGYGPHGPELIALFYRHGVPAVLMTGDPEAFAPCGVPMLPKPFRMEELERVVNEWREVAVW